jgi:hypothetical protein
MNLDESFAVYLNSVSAVTAICGNRIYAEVAAQDAAAPRIVFSIAFPEAEMDDLSNDRAKLAKVTYEFRAMAKTFDVARALGAAVQAALIGFHGVMGGVGGAYISSICAAGRRSDYAAADGIRIMSCEFEIFYYI